MDRDHISYRELRDRLNASVTTNTALTMALLAGGALVAFVSLGPQPGVAPTARATRMTVGAILLVLSLAAYFIARHGRVRLAAAIFSAAVFTLFMAVPVVLELGVYSAGLPMVAGVIMLAGFLVGAPAALATTALSVAAVLGLYAAQRLGVLSGPTPATAPRAEVITGAYVILFVFAGWLTKHYAQLFGDTILRLETSRRNLEETLAAQRLTEAKLRESEERHRLVLEHSPAGIVRYDRNLVVTYCNARMAEIMHAPRAYFLGLDLNKLKDQGPLDALRGALAGQDTRYEGEYRTTYGNLALWLLIVCAPLRDADGAIQGGIGIVEDISERRRNEAALYEAKEAAEAANRAKSQFLATMSHEIRTPLNGVLGMAQLLLMPRLTDEERHEFAATILTSGQTLLTLLNEILDLSKVEAGKLELARAVCDMRTAVEDTAALFAEPAAAKGLAITAAWLGAEEARYWADPMRIRQMLSNLVSNAVKFTAHGSVRIEAAEVERADGKALIEFAVTDTGIGIAADKQCLLFKPFSQADSSTTREYGGSGLGLSIVRSLARLMDGEVGVRSEAGGGARFWFCIRVDIAAAGDPLPAATAGAARAPAVAAAAGSVAARVLVVEDNPTNWKVVEALLANLGASAARVENGREAVAAVTRGARPGLVLMDVHMPVMDGLEATERIRRWELETGQPRLPIVALTAWAFEQDRQHCVAAGMDDFLAKPVDLDALASVLSKWLPTHAGGAAPAGAAAEPGVDA